MTVDHIKNVKDIPRLKQLRFDFCEIKDGTILEFSKMPIEYLSFANCSFWLKDLEALKNKELLSLRFRSCIILKSGMTESEVDEKVSQLRQLDQDSSLLASARFATRKEPVLIESLSKMKNIKRLKLENIVFTKSSLEKLAEIKALRRVDFANCDIDISTLKAFAKTYPQIQVFY